MHTTDHPVTISVASGQVRPKTSRRETAIVSMLEEYADLTDPSRRNGIAGSGNRTPIGTHEKRCVILNSDPPHCNCAYRTVRELERLLFHVMPAERPKQFRHIRARYITRTQALKDVPVKRKTKKGKTVTVLERQRVDIYPAWVRNHTVELGITWLANRWELDAEPFLPKELDIAA